jgi:hypothetical protein
MDASCLVQVFSRLSLPLDDQLVEGVRHLA